MDFQQIDFAKFGAACFPGLVGVEVVEIAHTSMAARLTIRPELFAPNGFVHAGSIVTLADTLAGYACIYHLPVGAKSFTTVELKTNFLGAAREGHLLATATLQHGGKTTQVWDVVVRHEETDKTIALFRCTQLILYGV